MSEEPFAVPLEEEEASTSALDTVPNAVPPLAKRKVLFPS